MGPWYRIGLPLGNSLVLVAIVETIISTTSASHFLAYDIAEYHYGLHDNDPGDFRKDFFKYPLWVLLAVMIVTQLLADVILCFAVISKGSPRFLLFWIITTVIKNLYSAFIEVNKQWGNTYDISTALNKIFAFLWGTILFGFIVCNGFQALYYMMSENKEKTNPIGEGCCAIKDFYNSNPAQLATILLISEILINIHRSFNFPTSPFLFESTMYLRYSTAPDERGTSLSLATIVINCFGLIFVVLKRITVQRIWLAAYTGTIVTHLAIFLQIVFDWTAELKYPLMFDFYLATCILHLSYKSAVMYSVSKCAFSSNNSNNTQNAEETIVSNTTNQIV